MKAAIASLLAVGLVVVLTSPSEAASRKRSPYYYSYSYAEKFPSATPRQRHNAWAYNHAGHYYEMDSNAFPVGSQGWWEMKRIEGNGHRGR